MAAATNEQVQHWANERTRVRAEQLRNLLFAMEADNAAIGDVYENLNNNPDWTDERTDGPPHLLTGADILAFNTVSDGLSRILRGGPFADDPAKVNTVNAVTAQLAIVLKACVRNPG